MLYVLISILEHKIVCVCVCVRDSLNGVDICGILQGFTVSYLWYYYHSFHLQIYGSTFLCIACVNLIIIPFLLSLFQCDIRVCFFFIESGQFVRKHLILWPSFLHSSFSVALVSTLFPSFRTLIVQFTKCVVDKCEGSQHS
jgi:hypothetical protein